MDRTMIYGKYQPEVRIKVVLELQSADGVCPVDRNEGQISVFWKFKDYFPRRAVFRGNVSSQTLLSFFRGNRMLICEVSLCVYKDFCLLKLYMRSNLINVLSYFVPCCGSMQ